MSALVYTEGRFFKARRVFRGKFFDFVSKVDNLGGGRFFILCGYSVVYGEENCWIWQIEEEVVVEIEKTGCGDFWIWSFKFGIGYKEYVEKIKKIKEKIKDGYTYQVNFSFPVEFCFDGDAISFFLKVKRYFPVGYCQFLLDGNFCVCSFSPELFLERREDEIICEPMKGTWSDLDDVVIDEKTKAENVMIVDMVRNDLGRICSCGSIGVDLFRIVRYPTVVQMVSEVRGRIKDGIGWPDIFKALFPPASITGAPKEETVKIIGEIEGWKRGVYTGVMGWIEQDLGKFSVLIRTVELDLESKRGKMGVGSGIVWDSKAYREWREDLVKMRFLVEACFDFKLIETMRLENGRIDLLNYHIERFSYSAKFFGFRFSRKKFLMGIKRIIDENSNGVYKVRVNLSWDGKMRWQVKEIDGKRSGIWRVGICRIDILPKDRFHFRFKTTKYRMLLDDIRKESGYDEVIFVDGEKRVYQGTITNIFVKVGEDRFITPSLNDFVLDGVFRRHLIDSKRCIEGNIFLDDLEGGRFFLGNAVRGMVESSLCS